MSEGGEIVEIRRGGVMKREGKYMRRWEAFFRELSERSGSRGWKLKRGEYGRGWVSGVVDGVKGG